MVVDSKAGTFEVTAKDGKSLDYQAVASAIAKQHKTEWVEIAVLGTLAPAQPLSFKASATGQTFLLAEDPAWKKKEEKSPFQKLPEALKTGAKLASVTGRVVEQAAKAGTPKPPPTLEVTDFKLAKE